MSTLLKPLRKLYGTGMFGMPFGIDLRILFEAIDSKLTYILSFRKHFIFNYQPYRYFYHHYNHTSDNERTVEVPIITNELKKYPPSKILEVGNVLNHYQKYSHLVIDKYEQWPGVINQDVVTFHPRQRFDLIISISTLEHVGFDEPKKEPKKVVLAINNLITLLKPEGKLVFTVPIGSNPELDRYINLNQLSLTGKYFMKRINEKNQWIMCPQHEALRKKYGQRYPYANAIMIGEYQKVKPGSGA
jgi:hypothetical protein